MCIRDRALTVSGKSELKSSYSYLGGDTGLYGSKAASTLISKIAHGENGLRFEYSYDEVGNILTVKQYKGCLLYTSRREAVPGEQDGVYGRRAVRGEQHGRAGEADGQRGGRKTGPCQERDGRAGKPGDVYKRQI